MFSKIEKEIKVFYNLQNLTGNVEQNFNLDKILLFHPLSRLDMILLKTYLFYCI